MVVVEAHPEPAMGAGGEEAHIGIGEHADRHRPAVAPAFRLALLEGLPAGGYSARFEAGNDVPDLGVVEAGLLGYFVGGNGH